MKIHIGSESVLPPQNSLLLSMAALWGTSKGGEGLDKGVCCLLTYCIGNGSLFENVIVSYLKILCI